MGTWDNSDGSPTPLGVTWIGEEQAYNFALYSKYAERVTLLLYQSADLTSPVVTFEFGPRRNKTGRVWHTRIPKINMRQADYYAYSIDGPAATGSRFERHAFKPQKVLLDPYAKAVFFPAAFDRNAALGSESNAGKAPLGVIAKGEKSFDWGDDVRPRHDSDLIIYELHVRGFTMNPNSGVSSEKHGTFSGVIEKIPYLQKLGITAVELMPVFEFDETEPNYWGYMPLNYFSPHYRYATGTDLELDSICEFCEMVRALHKAGIEVILDVVYNHTGEGNAAGPTFSFKGIDNSTYYMASDDPNHPYADYTGTGNTLHCANRAVRQLIVDSLRYWAGEMHVDGFRFDLASVFSRNSDGSINFDDPPIFGDIATDPSLSNVRMIAEPWEGNSQYANYELGNSQAQASTPGTTCCLNCGMQQCQCPKTTETLQRSFPGTGWRQWNDRFRTTVRHFVKSDSGTVSDLMTRIYGSSDVFPDSLREAYRPWQSLNYISSHDGLTLYDLVAYNSPDSWNCGDRDGETGPRIDLITLRKRQVKNFFCLLMLSNGTPMFRAGDEFLQTQQGNPNPYNVDSPMTWLDWSRVGMHEDVFRFFQNLIVFRKKHPSISRSTFWREDIHWYGPGRDVDWSYDSHTLAYCLHGGSQDDGDLYVMINAFWDSVVFDVQEGKPEEWFRVVDTYLKSPEDIVEATDGPALAIGRYAVQPRSIVVLLRPQATGPR